MALRSPSDVANDLYTQTQEHIYMNIRPTAESYIASPPGQLGLIYNELTGLSIFFFFFFFFGIHG